MWKKLKGEDGSNSMDRISDLPKEILQRILYFLSQQESVRTSVLSKSWRYIWCTRPNLDFSDKNFKRNKQGFLSVVNKTLQRYCDQRLSLEEFRLCITDHEFVFEAESLKFLHLNKAFERVQVLHLHNVNFINEDTFDKITSSCPLLTTMSFQQCMGLKTIKLEKKLHKYLKHFTFTKYKFYTRYECSIEIDIPSLETINICGSKIHFHGHKFNNLKSLTLTRAEISQLCIDAPNILYFEYSGFCMLSICSTPTLRKSRLQHFIHENVVDAQSWFLTLSKLLHALRQSEIHLNIVQLPTNNVVHFEEDILIQDIVNGGNKPVVVEHFRLNIVYLSSVSYVLNGLFGICRPRKITTRWYTQGQWNKESKKTKLIEFICKIQMMRESGNQEIWKDLEDLRIERFDKSRQEWQPLHGTGLLLESALADFDRIRFLLKWSDQACESSSKLFES